MTLLTIHVGRENISRNHIFSLAGYEEDNSKGFILVGSKNTYVPSGYSGTVVAVIAW
jgi:hypothetical protein